MPPPPAEASHRTRSHVRAKSTCDAKGENRRDVTKEIKTISLELAKKDYKLPGSCLCRVEIRSVPPRPKTIGFNTKSWSNDLDDLGGTPMLGNLHVVS